jgi:hypothetical protein
MEEFDAFIDYVNAVDDPGQVTVRVDKRIFGLPTGPPRNLKF